MITLTASLFIGICIGYATSAWRQQLRSRSVPIDVTSERRLDPLDVLLNTDRRALDHRPN